MKTTDNKVIFNGLTYKLVLDEPEPVAEWKPRKGELCIFFNASLADFVIDYFEEKGGDYFVSNSNTWKHCRPLQDPDLIQMIPHDGGECPVPMDTKVLIKGRDGSNYVELAENLRWEHTDDEDDIVKYAVLK